jgi:hypothetical protein
MTKNTFNGQARPTDLSDDELLDRVQRQTLRYFWDFAHPDCGMARERSNVVAGSRYDLDCVTTGGTGFGIMALIAGADRGFLPRDAVRAHIEKIADFLSAADRHHGVFPHFLHGRTGKTIPFSDKDDGGDLVETSFLMMGLLTARQYFAKDPAAAPLCEKINTLWRGVEWDWHVRENNALLWHWSPRRGFAMNLPIQGWNECLVTHVLAAAAPAHGVPPDVYHACWTAGKDFKNPDFNAGETHQPLPAPLGPKDGGPLFFAHYSFLGLDPRKLKDAHADYFEQNLRHVLINRAHCVENPHGHKGYGPRCWGLTACDEPGGYGAHCPQNDNGTIAPTAAISSLPYAAEYSMQALRHFYHDLHGQVWREYGFIDAFNENAGWYADSHLAIDQGPIVVMIENFRSGLLWDLFMSCPEITRALDTLGFEKPLPQKPSSRPAPRKKS